MVDITDKKNSLREATAQAIIRVNSLKTINAIEQNKVPKGMFLRLVELPDF